MMRYIGQISMYNDIDDNETRCLSIKSHLAFISETTTEVSCVKVQFKYWDIHRTKKKSVMTIFRMKTGNRSEVYEFEVDKRVEEDEEE